MRGALLRSGKSGSFTALGETGQPVYRAALQLREAIRRKNPELVDHLAILKAMNSATGSIGTAPSTAT